MCPTDGLEPKKPRALQQGDVIFTFRLFIQPGSADAKLKAPTNQDFNLINTLESCNITAKNVAQAMLSTWHGHYAPAEQVEPGLGGFAVPEVLASLKHGVIGLPGRPAGKRTEIVPKQQ